MSGAQFTGPGFGTVTGVDFRTGIHDGTATSWRVLRRHASAVSHSVAYAFEVIVGLSVGNMLPGGLALLIVVIPARIFVGFESIGGA